MLYASILIAYNVDSPISSTPSFSSDFLDLSNCQMHRSGCYLSFSESRQSPWGIARRFMPQGPLLICSGLSYQEPKPKAVSPVRLFLDEMEAAIAIAGVVVSAIIALAIGVSLAVRVVPVRIPAIIAVSHETSLGNHDRHLLFFHLCFLSCGSSSHPGLSLLSVLPSWRQASRPEALQMELSILSIPCVRLIIHLKKVARLFRWNYFPERNMEKIRIGPSADSWSIPRTYFISNSLVGT